MSFSYLCLLSFGLAQPVQGCLACARPASEWKRCLHGQLLSACLWLCAHAALSLIHVYVHLASHVVRTDHSCLKQSELMGQNRGLVHPRKKFQGPMSCVTLWVGITWVCWHGLRLREPSLNLPLTWLLLTPLSWSCRRLSNPSRPSPLRGHWQHHLS